MPPVTAVEKNVRAYDFQMPLVGAVHVELIRSDAHLGIVIKSAVLNKHFSVDKKKILEELRDFIGFLEDKN